MFDVVNFTLCGVNHTCSRGVNIISMSGLNYAENFPGTDVTVGGGNDVWDTSICGGAVDNILVRYGDRGGGGLFFQCSVVQ